MKKLFLLLAFITLTVSAQTNPISYSKLKLTANQKCNTCTRFSVQDSITGEIKWMLKSNFIPPSASFQTVTNVGATTTNQITVQNVKIGSNAFANTFVGAISNLPTGTGSSSFGYNAGNNASGYGGTYLGAFAGSLNTYNKNICISANANASKGSADNQFVINTNGKNVRFDTNVPLDILFQYPEVGGRFPISVNGNTADSNGNITVSSGSGTVSSFAFTNANGITGSVTNSTTTPTLVLSLGAITPTTIVASSNISGSNLTGTNTGDQDLSGLLVKANNFSDVTNTTTARTNLGLGTLATQSGTFTAKQDNISLTTTGSSGAATFVSNTLNVPTYTLSGLGGQAQLSGTGFIKASGTTISYDNSTYLTTSIAASTYAPISTTPIILLNDNTTTSAVTGTTSNTILASYLIPANTFESGDRILIDFVGLKSTTTASGLFNINVNTTNSLSGATKIAGMTGGGAGNRFYVCQRSIAFKSSTSFETLNTSVNNAYDLGVDNNAPATITYDTTQDYYLIISVIPTNSADSFNQSRLSVTKFKSKTTF